MLLSKRVNSPGSEEIYSVFIFVELDLICRYLHKIFLGPCSQRSDVRSLLRELLGCKGAIPHSPTTQRWCWAPGSLQALLLGPSAMVTTDDGSACAESRPLGIAGAH